MPPKKSAARGTKQPSADLIKLMTEDLARSGLTYDDGRKLGMHPLSAAETQALGPNFAPLPAMMIPYYDPRDPSKPLAMLNDWPQFYRVRYLATPNDFNALTDKRPQRYMQPALTGVCAYWPRLIDWARIVDDVETPLIITEGEKKAAAACIAGFPTVGLGGVWSFRSAQHSMLLIPDLARVKWARRNVYIIYDSDSRTNPDINNALWRLAEELEHNGAMPHVCTLPDVYEEEGKKTGLDDFLVSGHELGPVLSEGEPLTLARALWDMNRKVVYVRDPGLIVERSSGARLAPGAFKEHIYAAENYAERRLEAEGRVSLKRVSAAAAWLRWPHRSEVSRITYRPGAEREVTEKGERLYNVWPGWGCEPKKGDIKPFMALLDHLFTGVPKEEKEWLLKWLAYPLQYPGTKLFTAVVMFGVEQGTGKSLVGITMGGIYGKNFTELSQSDFESNFNEWAAGKQFIMGDDVTGHDRRAYSDMLKKMITQKEMRVNAKFLPTYVVPDCLNYYFTSNQPDAFFIEDSDRRYFVHEVRPLPLEQEFYREYGKWLERGGPAAVFHYLLNLDLGDFDPAAPALRTLAKANMTMDAKGEMAAWIARLIQDPDGMLRVGEAPVPGDLFTNRTLLAIYDPMGRTGATANGLGRELKRAGVVQCCGGQQIRTNEGVDRYYALRNPDKWRGATLNDVKKHIAEVHGAAHAAPKKPKY